MSLNYAELDLILEELHLENSLINKIKQIDYKSLFLEVFKEGKRQLILISLAHGQVRIHRMSEKPQKEVYNQRFEQLLRSRLKGAIIRKISQPEKQRIIHLQIENKDDSYNLWIRLWSGNPNMILTNKENIIIDCFNRKVHLNEIAKSSYNPLESTFFKNNSKIRHIRSFDSKKGFNRSIELIYSQKGVEKDFQEQKHKISKLYEKKMNNIESHIQVLDKRLALYTNYKSFKILGELIQINKNSIKKGDTQAKVYDFNSEHHIEIILKKELSPQENSLYYFNKYKRFKNGINIVNQERKTFLDHLCTINEAIEKIQQSTSLEDLSSYSLGQTESIHKPEKNQIGLIFNLKDFLIFVGRNSKENDTLLRKKAKGNDMWLHLRDYPGGFVFIRGPKGKSIPLEILLDGANLSLLYSSKKYKDKGEVHYTQVKNLRRVKGGKEGLVLANNEKNLSIVYDQNRINKLQQKNKLLERNSFNYDN